MPLHNTKGNARGMNNRIKRANSGLGPIEAFKNAKARLFKVVTRNFYNSHIALVDSPAFNQKLGDAKREIDNSSCLILARPDVARLIAVIQARRDAGVQKGNSDERSRVYDSGQHFEIMCWGASGKGTRVNATFDYIMLKEKEKWYLHHLEGTTAIPTSGGVLSPSELESSASFEEDDPFDVEDEGSFEGLRNLFPEG